jgi:hypothetical protein
MIDMMAKRYGLLPTEVLERATTFDMVIMDMSMTYEHYLQNKDKKDFVPSVDPEELARLHKSL